MSTTYTNPSPITWTIRLKHHRTTIVLHANPLQTFTSIKSQLLSALRDTQPDGKLEDKALPSSPSEIVLGRPVDMNDPNKGFVLGEWEQGGDLFEDEDGAEGSKGKGKAVAKGKGRSKREEGEEEEEGIASSDSVKDCLKGAGFRDGAVFAFKWGEEAREDNEDEEMDAVLVGKGDSEWDVIIPSYEDAYGVENVGDVGGRKPFEG